MGNIPEEEKLPQREVKVESQSRDFDSLAKDDSSSDFGKLTMLENVSTETMRNAFGDNLELKSKNDYWEDIEIKDKFTDAFGTEGAEEKFDLFYKNLQGQYSRYQQDTFDEERTARAFAGTGFGRVDKAKSTLSPITMRSVDKLSNGGFEHNGEVYGISNSNRENATKSVTLYDKDEAGNTVGEKYDLTPSVIEELEEMEGFDGFAYDATTLGAGKFARGKLSMNAIFNGKVWDEQKGKFENVKNEQIVSNWDLPSNSMLNNFFKGNDLAMDGMEYAKLLLRSPMNTAVEFLDIIPQIGRGVLAMGLGDKAEESELYQKFTSWGINIKGYKTSLSDEAMKDGFFGSAEVFLGTVGDVVSQLYIGGGIGKITSKAVTGYSKMAGAVGATGTAARSAHAANSISGFSTRMALTMMAAKDMYQETLDHGFTKREAGFAMSAAIFGMWKANSFSSHLINGVEPNALKHYAKKWAKKTAKSMYANGTKEFASKGSEQGAKKLMEIGASSSKKLNSWITHMKEFTLKNDGWFSAVEEMTEEVMEELSSEGVRQMMNGYKLIRKNDLSTMKVGEGRFKSYWDKGYWQELSEGLILSGIGGAMGGPIGKLLHGGLKTSTLSDNSTITDFVLAGGTSLLKQSVIDASKENAYAPKGMTTEFDETVQSFITGGSGKQMNDIARDALLQDIAIIDAFVTDIGFDNVKGLIDNDPLLKDQLDNTSILNDTKKLASKMQTLLAETGVTTEVLKSMQDNDMQGALVIAGEESAQFRAKLLNDNSNLDIRIEEIKELKRKAESDKNDGKEGEVVEKEEDIITTLEKDIQGLVNTKESNDKKIKDLIEGVSRGKLLELQKLNVEARGLLNGSKAEVYYLQHTLYEDAVFGAVHNRSPEFQRYGKEFFANMYESSRNSIYENNMQKADIVEKSIENDAKIAKMTVDNVIDYQELMNDTPYMSDSSVRIITDIKNALIAEDKTLEDSLIFAKSETYISSVINEAITHYDSVPFTSITEHNSDGTSSTTNKAADGMTTELLDYIKTAEFKNALMVMSAEAVEGTQMINDTKLLYINLDNLARTAKALKNAQTDPDYKEATFVQGEFDPSNFDRRDSFLMEVFDIDDSFYDDGDLVNNIGSNGLISFGTITEAEKSTTAKKAVDMFKKVAEGDPRLGIIKNLYNHVTEGVEAANIKELDHINPEGPKGLDPFNMEWMIQSISLTESGKFKTKKANIIDGTRSISDEIHISEDGKKYFLDGNQAIRVQELQHATEIRIAQKRVLGQILGGTHPSGMGGKMIDKMAGFRKNINKILGKDSYPITSKFSQGEEHNYKQNTMFSDFVNDFVIDVEEMSRILKKVDAGTQLTDAEATLKLDYENFLLVLMPRTSINSAKEGDIDTEIVTDIRTSTELASAQRFMEKTMSLEQAHEILLGLQYLASEQGFNPAEEESTEFLKLRFEGLKNKILNFKNSSATLDGIEEALRDNSEEIPTGLEAFMIYLEGFSVNDLVTESDFLQAEKLLNDFLASLPKLKKKLSAEQFKKVADISEDYTPQEFYVYSEGFNINEFNKYYKELLEEEGVEEDIPTYEQEKVASLVVAFLNTPGPVQTSGSNLTNTLAIDGVAGSGKTKLIGKLALKIAQRMQKGDKNKIMYASNHKIQIDNLKEGLEDVVTSGEGKDLKGLFHTLTEYVNTPGNTDIQKEVDESMVILYDEATLIDARKKGTDGEESLHKLLELLEKVNNVRKIKGINPLKTIFMGDSKQTGFKQRGGTMVSDFFTILNGYGAVKTDPLTFSFRVNNSYLRDGLNAIRGTSKKELKKLTFYHANQPDYNNILTGIQPVFHSNPDFNEMLDSDLERNIREQIEKDDKFTVGIAPDSDHAVFSPEFLQLISDYPNNVFVVSTDKIQGSEFNYVITEFTNEYIGNYRTGASKSEMEKDMYTLLSRGKDYVRVFIKNDLPVTSVREGDGKLVLESKVKFDNNKKLLYDYLMKLLADSESFENEKIGHTPEEFNKDNTNRNPCIKASGGKFGSICMLENLKLDVNAFISTSMEIASTNAAKEVLTTLEQSELTDAKNILATFNSILKQDANTIKELLSNEDKLSNSDFSDAGKKWVRNNKKEIEILTEKVQNTEAKERDNITSIINDAILQNVVELDENTDLTDIGAKLKFSDEVIKKLRKSNPEIKLESQFIFDLLQSQLTKKIAFVNDSSGKISQEETSLEATFRKDLIKYKSYEGYLNRIKDLEEIISNRNNSNEELVEYEQLTNNLEFAKKSGIIQDSYIEPFTVNENGINGSIVDESSVYQGELDKSYIYNAKMNQPKEFGGMGRVRLNHLTESQASYVHNRVLKNTEYEGAATSTLDVKKILETQKIIDTTIVGTNMEYKGKVFTNSVVVGSYITRKGEKKSVVLGKIFLGEDGDEKLRIARKEGIVISKEIGLTGDRKITIYDPLEMVQKKLFPTTYRLIKKIQGTYGTFKEKIPTDVFFKNFSLGAGAIKNKNKNEPHISFEQLLRNNVNGVQISKIVTIAKEPLGNVPAGKPFVLYSSDNSIDLNDSKTVLRLLKTVKENGGKFPNVFSNSKGHQFPIDIGILPLDNKNMSFSDIFNRHKDTFFLNRRTHSMENSVFAKRSETVKVAKVLGNVMDQLLGTPDLVAKLTKYDGTALGLDADGAQKKLASIEIFSRETHTGPDKKLTSGKVPDSAFSAFIDKLSVPNGSKLTQEDLISSVFVPMLRNFKTEAFTLTGSTKYKARYNYSMFKSFVDKSGNKKQEFNIPNMVGGISMELAHRMSAKYGTDQARNLTEKYMNELILPSLMELFANSEMFKQYAVTRNINTDKPLSIKLLNGKFVSSTVAFTTETLGDKNITDGVTTNSDFFVADGGKINHSYLITSAKSIAYPGGNFDMGGIMNNWYEGGKEEDPLKSLYTPVKVIKSYDLETITKKIEGIRARAAALNEKSSEEEVEEVRNLIEGLQEKVTPTIDDFSPHNRMEVRAKVSEAIAALVNNASIKIINDEKVKILSMGDELNSMYRDFLQNNDNNSNVLSFREEIKKKFATLDVETTSQEYGELKKIYNSILSELLAKYNADMATINSVDKSLKALGTRIALNEDVPIEDFDAVKMEIVSIIKISPFRAQNFMDNLARIAFDSNKYTIKTPDELKNHFRNNADDTKPVKDPEILQTFQNLKKFLTENGFSVTAGDELVIDAAKRKVVFTLNKDNSLKEFSQEMIAALADTITPMMLGTKTYLEFEVEIKKSKRFRRKISDGILARDTERRDKGEEKGKDDYADDTRLEKKYINILFNNLIKDSVQRKFRDEFIEDLPKTFLDRILGFTNSIISYLKGLKLDVITSAIDSKVADVFEGKFDTFRVEPNEGYIEIDFQEAFNSDQEAHRLQSIISMDPDIVLTGSIAIAAQGSIYRSEDNMVHDLDYSVQNKTREEVEATFPNLFKDPTSVALISSFSTPTNDTSTFLVPPEGHRVINVHKLDARKNNLKLPFKDRRVFNINEIDVHDPNSGGILYSYDVVDANNNVVLSYKMEYEVDEFNKAINRKDVFVGNQDLKASPIDLFTRETSQYTVTTTKFIDTDGNIRDVGIKTFGSVFDAKIDMGRLKDTMDYTNFRPKLIRGITAAKDVSKLSIKPSNNLKDPLTIQLNNGMIATFNDTDTVPTIIGADGKNISDKKIVTEIMYTFFPDELDSLLSNRARAVEDYDRAVITNDIKKLLNNGEKVVINIHGGGGINAELSNFKERPFKYSIGGKKFKFQNVESAYQAYKILYSDDYSNFVMKKDANGNDTNEVELNKIGLPKLNDKGITAVTDAFGDTNGRTAQSKRFFFNMSSKVKRKAFDQVSHNTIKLMMTASFEANESDKNLLINTIDSIFTHNFPNGTPIENAESKVYFTKALTDVRTTLLAKKYDKEERAVSVIKTKLEKLNDFTEDEIKLIDSVITMKTQISAVSKLIDKELFSADDRKRIKAVISNIIKSGNAVRITAGTKLNALFAKCN